MKFTWFFEFHFDVSHVKMDFFLEMTNSQMQELILLKHHFSERKYFDLFRYDLGIFLFWGPQLIESNQTSLNTFWEMCRRQDDQSRCCHQSPNRWWIAPSERPLNRKVSQVSRLGIGISVLFTGSTCPVSVTKTDGCSEYCQHPLVQLYHTSSQNKCSSSCSAAVPLPRAPFRMLWQLSLHVQCKSLCSLCLCLYFFFHFLSLLPYPFWGLSELSAAALDMLFITLPLLSHSCHHPVVPVPHHSAAPISGDALFTFRQLPAWISFPSPESGPLAFHLLYVSLGAWLGTHRYSGQQAFPHCPKRESNTPLINQVITEALGIVVSLLLSHGTPFGTLEASW